MARVLGILLAGGRGTRLGLDVPKALVTLGGATLLDRALATLRACCDDVVVCAPAALQLPLPDDMRVDDPLPGEGPLAALAAGLAARPFVRALVLGVDLPFVTAQALTRIAAAAPDAPAVLPAPGGRAQPLAAAYGPQALAPLAAAVARGERALVPAVLALGATLLDDDALAAAQCGPDTWFNLNTPDDLAAAKRRVAAERSR